MDSDDCRLCGRCGEDAEHVLISCLQLEQPRVGFKSELVTVLTTVFGELASSKLAEWQADRERWLNKLLLFDDLSDCKVEHRQRVAIALGNYVNAIWLCRQERLDRVEPDEEEDE